MGGINLPSNVISVAQSFNKANNCDSNNYLRMVLMNLSRQIKPNDFIFHDVWLTKEDVKWIVLDLKRKSIRHIYYVSLVDELSHLYEYARKKFTDICEQVIVIGNTNPSTSGYYSFWLDFAYTYKQDFLSFDVEDIQSKPKTFMCLNRKPHHHRFYLWRKLCDNKLRKHGHISYANIQNLTIDIDSNSKFETEMVIPNNIQSLGHPINWNTHFLNIVTETSPFGEHFFITEKTFKPIIGHRPFLVLANSTFYDGLHKLGFDTFDDIFGTGYKAGDGAASLPAITKWIINVIQEMKKENKVALYKKLLPRLKENYKVFLKIGEENKKRRDNLCR